MVMAKTRKKRSTLFLSVMEVRAIEYVVRELARGRELFDILEDPYVRNRIAPERRHALQEDEELLEAFQAEIAAVRSRMEAEGQVKAVVKPAKPRKKVKQELKDASVGEGLNDDM